MNYTADKSRPNMAAARHYARDRRRNFDRHGIAIVG
jgi:hypothetical protein